MSELGVGGARDNMRNITTETHSTHRFVRALRPPQYDQEQNYDGDRRNDHHHDQRERAGVGVAVAVDA